MKHKHCIRCNRLLVAINSEEWHSLLLEKMACSSLKSLYLEWIYKGTLTSRSGINASVKFTPSAIIPSLAEHRSRAFTLQNYICFASHPSAKNSRAIYFRRRNLLVPVARAQIADCILPHENQIAFLKVKSLFIIFLVIPP
jgi:hypothetical protein